jgi:cytochrome c oxidase subunit 2
MSTRTDRRRWLAAVGAVALGGAFGSAAQAKPRTIHVVAKKFVFVPNEIRLKRDETVRLSFTAPEVPMGANFPDFGVRTDIVPGQPAQLQLTADKAGRFTFLCDVFCGTGHEDMSGTVVVEG